MVAEQRSDVRLLSLRRWRVLRNSNSTEVMNHHTLFTVISLRLGLRRWFTRKLMRGPMLRGKPSEPTPLTHRHVVGSRTVD